MKNDFTIEELIILKHGLEYLPNSLNISNNYLNKCGNIINKINQMIYSYCDHDGEIGKDYPAEKCMKCNRMWE